MLPRGLRNNNPGNIDYVKRNSWIGQIGLETDTPKGVTPRFAKFDTMDNGIRALCRLLRTYMVKHNLRTIRQIASRYAPPNENATEAYAKHVAEWSGLGIDETLNPKDLNTFLKLVPAIIRKENGYNPVHSDIIYEGCRRALC